MYARKHVSLKIVWFFSCWPVIGFTALSSLAYIVYVYFKITLIAIPFLPVATVGTAVAFYVGFKNNASYERLWEARKIWAEIEHLCRFWTILLTQAHTMDSTENEENFRLSRRLVYRQIAWVNCLRFELRNDFAYVDFDYSKVAHIKVVAQLTEEQSDEIKEIVGSHTPEQELSEILKVPNKSAALLARQVADLNSLRRAGLSDEEYEKLLGIMQDCSQQQSASERINRFPFPRQYAQFSALFVYIFIVLLPFSLLNELAKNDPPMLWLTVPISVLLSWIFYTMEKVGDTSENPFENGLNDVPITSICRDIEIELKSLLRESHIPERMKAKEGVLM